MPWSCSGGAGGDLGDDDDDDEGDGDDDDSDGDWDVDDCGSPSLLVMAMVLYAL